MNAILDILIKQYHLPGCEKISRQYQALITARNLDVWAEHFKSNMSLFEEGRGDFTKENLSTFFQKIFEDKCKDSWDPLEEMFVYIWNCRYLTYNINVI